MDKIDMRGGFWNTLITLLAALGAVVLAVVTHSVTSYALRRSWCWDLSWPL